jgi:hypothetical protein
MIASLRKYLSRWLLWLVGVLDEQDCDHPHLPPHVPRELDVLDTMLSPPQWRRARATGIAGLRLVVQTVDNLPATTLCVDVGQTRLSPAEFVLIWNSCGGAALVAYDDEGNQIELM